MSLFFPSLAPPPPLPAPLPKDILCTASLSQACKQTVFEGLLSFFPSRCFPLLISLIFYLYFSNPGPIVDSCSNVHKHGRKENGFYSLSAGAVTRFTAYCDLGSEDTPWTVIQRRLYGSEPVDYHSKSWTDYKDGFKSDEMNFWLGNKHIHELTKTPHRLKIVITTEEFHTYMAVYENFSIQDETSGYQIQFGSYSGLLIFIMSCKLWSHFS